MSTRLTIISIGLFAGAVLVGFFLGWPQYQKYMATIESISRAQVQITNQIEYGEYLEETNDKLADYTEEIEIIEKAVPTGDNLPLMYDFFLSYPSEKGVLMGDVGINVSQADEGLGSIDIHMGIIADYDSFKSFLYSLERSERFFEIGSLAFSSPDLGAPFSFNIGMKAFYEEGESSESSPEE